MPDEEPKPEHEWKRKHPVLGFVVGTLDDIAEQRAAIEMLVTGFKALEQRVIKIESQLQVKPKRKKVKPNVRPED